MTFLERKQQKYDNSEQGKILKKDNSERSNLNNDKFEEEQSGKGQICTG